MDMTSIDNQCKGALVFAYLALAYLTLTGNWKQFAEGIDGCLAVTGLKLKMKQCVLSFNGLDIQVWV